MSGLAGRVVWVTGASGGIGRALAEELIRRRCRVALTARGAETLEQIAPGNADVLVAPGDIADREAVRAAAALIVERWGSIDVAVLNAGAYEQVTPEGFGADVFRRQLEVNIMGTVHCIEAVLPDMRRRGRGRIAVVSSVTGWAGTPLAAAYGASKAFLTNMTDALRADLRGEGVGVTLIAPGFVRSGLTDQNAFRMPLLMEASRAATIIADGLERGAPEIAFPRPTVAYFKLQQALPGRLRRALALRTARRVYREEGLDS